MQIKLAMHSLLVSFSLEDGVIRLLETQRLQIGNTSEFHHWRRTAHQNLSAPVARRGGQMSLNHLLRDEPGRVLPTPLRRTIHRVMQLEPSAKRRQRALQLLPNEDVVLRLVRVQQRHGHGRVRLVAQHRVHYLQHGRDARASGDHPEVPRGTQLGGILLQNGMDGELTIFVVGHVPCIIATIEYGHETSSRMGMKRGMI